MPTGYTAQIADGITFKQYALKCTRAFGALINMRDDDWNKEIPDKIEPSNYYLQNYNQSVMKLEEFLKKSDEELKIEFENWKKDEIESNKKCFNDRLELKAKYLNILEQAKNYIVPSSEHIEYKKFMISQIEDSIEWDCDISYIQERINSVSSENFENWKKKTKKSLISIVESDKESYEREVLSCDEKTKWIQIVKKSLEKY